MNKAVFFAAAMMFAPLPALAAQDQPTAQQDQGRQPASGDSGRVMDRDSARGGGEDWLDRLARGDLRDRVSRASARIEEVCGDDFERFCGDVTPGGGRFASCVDAFSDQMSRRCRFVLLHAVDRVQRAVEQVTEDCVTAIDQQCRDASDLKQCLQQKNASLPQSCRTIVAAAQQGRQRTADSPQEPEKRAEAPAGGPSQDRKTDDRKTADAKPEVDQAGDRLRGMVAHNFDGKTLGPIVQVKRGADGKIQSIQIEVGRNLGLGEKTIAIPGDRIELRGDGVRVMMTSDEIRSLPEEKGQASGTKAAK